MTRCALCDTQIIPANDTREHILPNSIGGRRKVSGFICTRCNNTCGTSWDAALAKQLNPLSLFFDIKRERGEPQSQVFNTTSGGSIMITTEGLTLPEPRIEVKKTDTGTTIQVNARTMNEAKHILKELQGEYPEVDINTNLTKAQVNSSYFNEMIKFDLAVGGADAGRSIVKSVFALAVANGVSSQLCEEARRYLASGENACFGYYYEADLVRDRPEKSVLHCVAICSTDSGLLLGYIELFSIYRMVVCLSASYSGPPVSAVYAINPMNGVEQDVKVDLDFSLEDIEDIYAYKRIPEGSIHKVVERVIPIGIQLSIEKERKAVVERAMRYAWDNCGAEPGAVLTRKHVAAIASMVAEQIAPFLLHMARNGMLFIGNGATSSPEGGDADGSQPAGPDASDQVTKI